MFNDKSKKVICCVNGLYISWNSHFLLEPNGISRMVYGKYQNLSFVYRHIGLPCLHVYNNGVSPVASGNKSLSCLPTTTRSMATGENHLFPFANYDS